jgi:hypothetical protein
MIHHLAQIGAAAFGLLILVWLVGWVLKAFGWIAAAIGARMADWSQRRIDDHYGPDPRQDPPDWFDHD